MQQNLKDSTSEAFTSRWMKGRLTEQFKHEIVITEINGKQNVVTFRSKARNILHEFYKSYKSDDVELEKIRIIETAAMLLKNEIKECYCSTTTYPSIEDIESLTHSKEFLSQSLQLLLEKMLVAKGSDMRIASIGQAIMQAVRPKAIIAPLRIGLGVQMHRQFGSRFLIDSLHSHRFCSSYSEVQKFERSAAYHQGTEIEGIDNDSFIQHVADNVDHNVRTIDGLNTVHGMGIIAAVTPRVTYTKPVPRIDVSSKDIISIGSIETRAFRWRQKSNSRHGRGYRPIDFASTSFQEQLFSIGKGVALQKFEKDECFRRLTNVFNNPAATKEDVITVGEKLLLKVYGAKDQITLDKLRLTRFCQKVASSMKVVSPESLPPTSAAASLHSLRVYHQVQVWRDRQDLDPEACGWIVKARKLLPVYTTKAPAPAKLLKLFRCNCKKECRNSRCTCYKNGLKCWTMCGECRGVSCLNCQDPNRLENEDTDDEV
eukprot:gene2072-2349_t